jgi:hypothetical protein
VPSERCVKGLNTSTVNCEVKVLSVRMLFFKAALFDVDSLRCYVEKRSRRTPVAHFFTLPRHARILAVPPNTNFFNLCTHYKHQPVQNPHI